MNSMDFDSNTSLWLDPQVSTILRFQRKQLMILQKGGETLSVQDAKLKSMIKKQIKQFSSRKQSYFKHAWRLPSNFVTHFTQSSFL